MPRGRRAASSADGRRTRSTGEGSALLTAAEQMVTQIQELVGELAAVRKDNDGLRAELRDAVTMLGRASSALGASGGAKRGGRRNAVASGSATASSTNGRRRGGRRAAAPKTTTPSIDMVIAAIGHFGTASAGQVAEYITKATNTPVSGRSVRWVAERAGVKIEEGPGGSRLYRL